MTRAIILDAGPTGTLTNPNKSAKKVAVRSWLDSLLAAGQRVILAEISDYEVRRELVRIKSHVALANLDYLGIELEYLPLSSAAMRLAAELWAQARNQGIQTAPDPALDGDVILAAQALTLGTPVVVATGNPVHLSRYVPADLWSSVTP